MKKTILGLGISLLATTGALANSAQVIYDTDGAERYSYYDKGPISAIVTSTTSATEIGFVIHPTGFDTQVNCSEEASLYNSRTGALLSTSYITTANAQGNVLWGVLTAPKELANVHKTAKFTCYPDDGSYYVVEHKIPAAPVIKWNMNISGVGEFKDGRYNTLKSRGYLNINNNSNEGICEIVERNFAPNNVFYGNSVKFDFYSDYFSLNEKITTHSGTELAQAIMCYNSGGETLYTKRWDISTSDIKLIENSVVTK